MNYECQLIAYFLLFLVTLAGCGQKEIPPDTSGGDQGGAMGGPGMGMGGPMAGGGATAGGPGGGGPGAGGGGALAPGSPGGFDPTPLFQSMDTNKDGKLEGQEIPETIRPRTADLDKDGDGAISLEEMRGGMPSMMQQ